MNEGINGSKISKEQLLDQAEVDVIITTVQRLHSITDKHFVNRVLSLTESLR